MLIDSVGNNKCTIAPDGSIFADCITLTHEEIPEEPEENNAKSGTKSATPLPELTNFKFSSFNKQLSLDVDYTDSNGTQTVTPLLVYNYDDSAESGYFDIYGDVTVNGESLDVHLDYEDENQKSCSNSLTLGVSGPTTSLDFYFEDGDDTANATIQCNMNPTSYESQFVITADEIQFNGSTSGIDYNDLSNLPTIPSISGCEVTSNKVTSLSAQSTDTQYPSAKCVYDIVGNIESALTTILGV